MLTGFFNVCAIDEEAIGLLLENFLNITCGIEYQGDVLEGRKEKWLVGYMEQIQ